MKTPAITWFFFSFAALGAVEQWGSGYRSWVLVVAAVVLAGALILAGRLLVSRQEWLLRWVAQPSFTAALVLFGYPFAEALSDPSDDLMTNVLVSTAFALAVLSIPRYALARAIAARRVELDARVAADIDTMREEIAQSNIVPTTGLQPSVRRPVSPTEVGWASLALLCVLLFARPNE
jgi:hypothetical protein